MFEKYLEEKKRSFIILKPPKPKEGFTGERRKKEKEAIVE